MAITDLKGTTWIVLSGWTAESGYGVFNVRTRQTQKVSGSNAYQDFINDLGHRLKIGYNGDTPNGNYITQDFDGVEGDVTTERTYSSIFSNTQPVVLSFSTATSGNDDATNAELIAWLESHAIQCVRGMKWLLNTTCDNTENIFDKHHGYFGNPIKSNGEMFDYSGVVFDGDEIDYLYYCRSDKTSAKAYVFGEGWLDEAYRTVIFEEKNTTNKFNYEWVRWVAENGTFLGYSRLVKYTRLYNNEVASTGGSKHFRKLDITPTLATPTISLADDILTITDNEGKAEEYSILIDGVVTRTTTNKSYNLSYLDWDNGSYSITVIAKADGYYDSKESNSVTYVVEKAIFEGSDLTGTTWLLNNSPNASSNATYNIDVTYSANGTDGLTTNTFELVLQDWFGDGVPSELCIYCGSDMIYQEGWTGPTPQTQTITITGGTDATNPVLIAWLKENSEFIGQEYPEEPILPVWDGTDLTGTTWEIPAGWTASAGYGQFDVDLEIVKINNVEKNKIHSNIDIGYAVALTSPDLTSESDVISMWSPFGSTITRNIVYNGDSFEITITGGTDVTNTSLIAWLTQYGTLTSHAMPEQPQEPENCLTFSSPSSFTIGVVNNIKYWDGTLEYSTDGSTWSTWAGTSAISSSADGKLYLRGTGNTKITGSSASSSKGYWVLTGSDISCNGNIETLLDYAIVANGQHPTMAIHCYRYMFYNCTSLVTAPKLPATTLTTYCYSYMFRSCTSLVTIPELPATTLAAGCYYYMFYGCTKIKLSTTQTGEYQTLYRIPTSGTGTDSLGTLSLMFNGTGGTFTGTPTINTTYYTSNTVV